MTLAVGRRESARCVPPRFVITPAGRKQRQARRASRSRNRLRRSRIIPDGVQSIPSLIASFKRGLVVSMKTTIQGTCLRVITRNLFEGFRVEHVSMKTVPLCALEILIGSILERIVESLYCLLASVSTLARLNPRPVEKTAGGFLIRQPNKPDPAPGTNRTPPR